MFNDFVSSLRGARTAVDNVGTEQFADMMRQNPDALVLDVRTPGEFAMGHIRGAVNLDMMDPRFREKIQEIDPATTVLIYCRSGNRSYHAGNMMKKLGFEHVYNLARGIIDWRDEIEY